MKKTSVLIPLLIATFLIVPSAYYLSQKESGEIADAGAFIGLDYNGNQRTLKSDLFYLNVTLESHVPFAGVQFSFDWDPDIVTFFLILPGEIFDTATSYMRYGDLEVGKVTGVAFAITQEGLSVLPPVDGVLATLVFTPIKPGTASFSISEVIVGDKEANTLDCIIKSETIIVEIVEE